MALKAKGKYVLLVKTDEESPKKEGTLLMPTADKEKTLGVIQSIGEHVPEEFKLKVGDLVNYKPHSSGWELSIKGVDYIVVEWEDIVIQIS